MKTLISWIKSVLLWTKLAENRNWRGRLNENLQFQILNKPVHISALVADGQVWPEHKKFLPLPYRERLITSASEVTSAAKCSGNII